MRWDGEGGGGVGVRFSPARQSSVRMRVRMLLAHAYSCSQNGLRSETKDDEEDDGDDEETRGVGWRGDYGEG